MAIFRPRPIRKYVESALPKNTYVAVRHYHSGNDPEGLARGGYRYVTHAVVCNAINHKPITDGWARCSKKDLPRRNVSRMIAVGRALKAYYNPQPF
jgi:hypothetical protein